MPNDAAGLPAILQQQGTAMMATETASSFVAAQAKALVEARYVIALRQPRNWDQVRQDILRDCRRPAFAHNKSAYYKKPIGAGVEGLGIRFVEVALRNMRNILVETNMIYEDVEKEVQRVTVTDLESNITYPLDVRVSKTVERSKPMDDGSYISMRTNSQGRKTYTVPGTDDDLLNKRAALISKAIRTLGLRIIPGDIQDEAEETIKSIRMDSAAKDPDGERKKIVDAFGELNVRAGDLIAYLGCPLEQCSPAQIVGLRGLYGAIKDGETTWREVIDNAPDKTPTAVDDINAKVAAGKGKPAPVTGAAKPGATAADPNVVTFAQVEESLNAAHAAGDIDKLNDVATLISSVAGAQALRDELTTLFRKHQSELTK